MKNAKLSRPLRALLIWFAVSAVLFFVAAYLTKMISAVHGRPPFTRAEESWSGDRPTQVVSIYLRPETKEFSQQTVVGYRIGSVPYRSKFDSEKYAFMEIMLPSGADAKILVNNVKDVNSCSSPRTATDFSEETIGEPPLHHLAIATSSDDKMFGTPLYVLTPEHSNEQYSVRCFLAPVAEQETFTTKRAEFVFYTLPDSGLNFQLFGADELKQYGLEGYKPVRGLIVDLSGIPDIEDLRFDGGFQEQQWAGYENIRVIPPGQFLRAHWKEIRSEQTRDILLVVIGTLIAIGATTLIEGLRPLFEIIIEGEAQDRKVGTVPATSEPQSAMRPKP